MAAKRFKARLGNERGVGVVEVPFDVEAAFGKKRAPVRITVNRHTFRSTVAVYGGTYFIGLNKGHRTAAGVDEGDMITVAIELDDEPRTVELPPDFAKALRADEAVKAFYDSLSFSHQREYVRWITEAKKAETRANRVAKSIEMLRSKVRTPG